MARSFAEYMAGPPGDGLRAALAEYDGTGTDHPGANHAYCRAVGQLMCARTRCCGKQINFGYPLWACEAEALPWFGADAKCCDRPYAIYGIEHVSSS